MANKNTVFDVADRRAPTPTPESGRDSPMPVPPDDEQFAGVSRDDRQGLLKTLTSALGLDITAITLPVTVNEPMSFLMRLCETYQYSELLDKANMCEESSERLLHVAAFVVSLYGNAERTGKPFNPLLGETYELVDEDRDNFRFVAEQVSHHPPVGACHCENDHFIITCGQRIKTKFTGNALECQSIGHNHVTLKRTNETFEWKMPDTIVHNVIVGGSIWFDHCGDVDVINTSTGEKCQMLFEKCGWFSRGWREVTGTVLDAKGNVVTKMVGKWNTGMFRMDPGQKAEEVLAKSEAELSKSEKKKQEKAEKKQDKAEKKSQKKRGKEMHKLIKKGEVRDSTIFTFTHTKLEDSELPNKYLEGWTAHSLYIVAIPPDIVLPPTDSRLRPDRLALEAGDTKAAGIAKYKLEQKQRDEKRLRGDKEWTPRYFKKTVDRNGQDYWEFNGIYWKEWEERQAQAKKDETARAK